jgi:hypothetical protein
VADAELIVRLRGENADLKAKLKEVTDASKGTASGMSSAFTGALSSIASAIGITFSVSAIVNFGKASVQAFMDSERAATALSNTMKNMGADSGQAAGIASMVDNLERMSGFDDAQLSAAFQDLMIQTGNSAKATEALNVAMDLSASSGDSLATSAQKVFQVMSGMTRSMREFGMTTREGATDMDYLRELGQKMSGSLAANLTTLDGQTRQLKTSWDNLKEAIGKALAPIVGPAMDKMSSIFDKVSLNDEWTSYLWTLEDPKQFDQLRKLGQSMGDAWKRSFLDSINGGSDLWDYSVFGQKSGTQTIQSSIYKPDTSAITSAANAFKAAWSPISMTGGNLPELTKYIGNLRQANTIKQKVTVDVQMTINGGSVTVKNANPVANAIAKAVAPAVQQAVTHGQGWEPPYIAAAGGGRGWSD